MHRLTDLDAPLRATRAPSRSSRRRNPSFLPDSAEALVTILRLYRARAYAAHAPAAAARILAEWIRRG